MQEAGRAMCRGPKDAHMVAGLHRVFSPPAKGKSITAVNAAGFAGGSII